MEQHRRGICIETIDPINCGRWRENLSGDLTSAPIDSQKVDIQYCIQSSTYSKARYNCWAFSASGKDK